MKVTVCFGNTKVVVPCGDGDLCVSDLIEKAVTRYKKAVGKNADYWVSVHSLKSYSDGGILDADDQLKDVADDREQILAIFEEQGGRPVAHNGGDGTSASSVGTSSPDIFQGDDYNNRDYDVNLRHAGKNDVIITKNDLNTGSTLIVRRGSEPSLTKFISDPSHDNHDDFLPLKGNKRWSAIASIDENKSPRESEADDEREEDTPPPTLQRVGGQGQEQPPEVDEGFATFARTSARRSLANNVAMVKWWEAQEKAQAQDQFEGQDQGQGRKEPLGGSGSGGEEEDRTKVVEVMVGSSFSSASTTSGSSVTSSKQDLGSTVVIRNTGGPLGIHVVPDYDDTGRDMGLVVQGIEPGGRIYRDGRLHAHDRIIEINGTNLVDVDFNKAQEVFRQALQANELRLRVLKNQAPPLPKLPPPSSEPKAATTNLRKQLSDSQHQTPNAKVVAKVKNQDAAVNKSIGSSSPEKSQQANSRLPASTPASAAKTQLSGVFPASSALRVSTPKKDNAEVEVGPQSPPGSPTRGAPPPVPARNPTTHLSSQVKSRLLVASNTRKIGKKIHIKLTKGAEGLGFSVTTRDNPAGGSAPIYIKNILPKGAAIQDGRLKSGDRLLEVNGVEVTGRSQTDTVSMLRNVKHGMDVELVVSRQVVEGEGEEDGDETLTATPTRGATPSKHAEAEALTHANALSGPTGKVVVSMEIPLGDATGGGLGVSVKGRTVTSDSGHAQDLGIFIKDIIDGGVASVDGRLRVQDQLVEVNGERLINKTNAEAMDILRRAMQASVGPSAQAIRLTVARRPPMGPPPPPPPKGVPSHVTGPPTPSLLPGHISFLDSTEMRVSLSEAGWDERMRRLSEKDVTRTDSESGKPSKTESIKSSSGSSGSGGSSSSGGDGRNATSAMDKNENIYSLPNKNRALSVAATNNGRPGDQKKTLMQRLAASSALRNVSYQMANHDSMINDTAAAAANAEDTVFIDFPPRVPPKHDVITAEVAASPARRKDIEDDVFTDDEEAVRRTPKATAPKARPASTLGFLPDTPNNKLSLMAAASKSNEDLLEGGAPKEWDEEDADVGKSMMEGAAGFHREGFGRQSVSEKRKGHLDPRVSEFYQKIKSSKDKAASTQFLSGGDHADIPSPGPLKRAGSAESMAMQTNNPRLSLHETVGLPPPGDLRYQGGSYPHLQPHDQLAHFCHHHHHHCLQHHVPHEYFYHVPMGAPLQRPGMVSYVSTPCLHNIAKLDELGPTLGLKKSSSLESLQTAVQEANGPEQDATGATYWRAPNRGMVRGRGCNDSFRAAVDRSYDGPVPEMETLQEEDDEAASGSHPPASRTSSFAGERPDSSQDDKGKKKKSKKDKEKEKEKEKDKDKDKEKGIFKGLFKFGKSRKSMDPKTPRAAPVEEKVKDAPAKPRQMTVEEEEAKLEEQYRKLEEKQREIEQLRVRESQARTKDESRSATQRPASPPPTGAPPDRSDRIQQLRVEHQRRHRERQGQYPLDTQQDQYERQIQEFEKQRQQQFRDGNPYGGYPLPPRRRPSDDPYDRAATGPPSRLAYTEPDHYSHYQNLQEIQAQLRRQDYYQQQYHQQMAPPSYSHYRAAPADTARVNPALDPRGVDPRGVDPRVVDPRVDPRGVDPRADPRGVDLRADPRGVDPRADPRGVDPRADPRADPRVDPRAYQRPYTPQYDSRDLRHDTHEWSQPPTTHYPQGQHLVGGQSQHGGGGGGGAGIYYGGHTPHSAMAPPSQPPPGSSHRTASPARPPNQTPLSHLPGYTGRLGVSATPLSGGLANPQAVGSSAKDPVYGHHPANLGQRTYSDFDDPRAAYRPPPQEYGYSSLPRRREHRNQNGYMPGAAQV